MQRLVRSVFVAALVLLMAGAPALAADEQPVIDLEEFINSFSQSFPDLNDDGIPDIPVGQPGIWDDTMNSVTEADFLARVDANASRVDEEDEGSTLIGPCGGVRAAVETSQERGPE